MRPLTLIALVAAAALAVAGGWYWGVATAPREQASVAAGGLMFPDLAARLHDVAKLEITHQGQQTVIEKRADGGWGIASMHDYPIQEAKLRTVLTALTELRLLEPRTSDPAEYGRLGVDQASGDLLQVVDAGGKPIVAVIAGHRRVRAQAKVPDEIYVRRPDEAQSWLAEGGLQVDADASQWLDRDILNIGQDRIVKVVVGDDALSFERVDGKFALTKPADHPKLEDYKVDNVSRALETLTLQAVKPDADAPKDQAGHAVFITKDGLEVAVTLLHADKDVWARFAVSGADTAKAEADRLSARLAGWTYQIGSWKEKSLVPALDDLKAAEPPARPAAVPEAAAPAQAGSPSAAEPQTAAPEQAAPSGAVPEGPAASPSAAAPEAGAPAGSPSAAVPEVAAPEQAGSPPGAASEPPAFEPAPATPEAAAPETEKK